MTDSSSEMLMLSRAQLSFFMAALWWPLLAVLAMAVDLTSLLLTDTLPALTVSKLAKMFPCALASTLALELA